VRALEAEGRSLNARADGFRRARVPSLTLSMFVQNDGFGERVFGLGIGLPLPLPHPVGRSFSGEIAESEALGRRAATEADRLRRLRRLDVAVALRAFSSHQAEVEAFPAEQMERAERALRSIEQELRGGRLALRDAIVAQQSLVELRRARIEARKALCLASVQLARVAGMPLERGGP
jgi:cobalt-zinc-cadmium efflux system outer membrane protein